MKFHVRQAPPRAAWALEQAGAHPLMAQLLAARGLSSAQDLDMGLQRLLPPDALKGIGQAAHLLAEAIAQDQRICIVADYDCDGATACATGLRGLAMLGARKLDYLVPNRMLDGYGLTPAIARQAAQAGAQLLITVDNGIASVEGVAAAQAQGMQVIITDHHLPGDELPAADALVNPNQPACPFPSKALAGVGVMFYVLLALRAHLRQQGKFSAASQPRLDGLLPLVALGTVADVVPLDANNRRLVAQGLRRIHAGQMPVGMKALFALSGRSFERANSFDMGFALGPRINAAGRLADMRLGIELLLTEDAGKAQELATQLDQINRQRRSLEDGMREQASRLAEQLFAQQDAPAAGIAVFDPSFHEGVVGIVAARLKDHWHRPCFVFAPGQNGELKGSGRSIAGFHLRDALDWISKRRPGLLLRFGGHAMAAGCSISAAAFAEFQQAFNEIAELWLDAGTLERRLQTDGLLPAHLCQPDVAAMLNQAVWGQGFMAPLFDQRMQVVRQRIVGEKHLALTLRHEEQLFEGIWFRRTEQLPDSAHLAFKLQLDEWQGRRRAKFFIEGMQEDAPARP